MDYCTCCGEELTFENTRDQVASGAEAVDCCDYCEADYYEWEELALVGVTLA